MKQITTEQLTRLIAAQEPPCVSLYQPTHRRHPENQQDPIRYRNLLVKMESTLREKYPAREIRPILERFQPLARDEHFWNYRADGLAIFGSPERFEVYELQRPVPELLVVADSFHTKPLIRILQSADRFHILCLTRHEAKLYEGNRDALDPIELTNVPSTIKEVLGDERRPPAEVVGYFGPRSGGGAPVHQGHEPQTDPVKADMIKFFRAVDRGILEEHSRPTGLPLLLAALPEHHAAFHEISHNPFLMEDGIRVDPTSLSIDELREQAWSKVLPHYLARLEKLKESFNAAWAKQTGSGDLADVAKAAIGGQVQTLLVEAERVIPGIVDRNTGSIRPPDPSSPHVDDMLDDVAELVLAKGGEVIVVPRERMPTDTGLAAIYRF